MGKLKKLLQKIKNNPKQVRFDELDKILTRAGFERRQQAAQAIIITPKAL